MPNFWSSKKIANFLILAIKYSLYGVPVIFLLASEYFLFPFVTTKVFIFRILIELIASLYLWLILICKEYRPQKSLLLFALGFYFVVQFLASALGSSFYRSWWGNFERMDGLVTQLHYLVFFVILSAVFKKKEDWMRLTGLSLIVSGLLFFVGILQAGGSQIYNFNVSSGRVTGSFGNSAYFSSYIISNIYLGIYLFFKQTGWKKYLLMGYVILAHIALFLTQTRGAVIGWAIGLVIFFSLWILLGAGRQRRRLFFAPVTILIVVVLGLYTFRNNPLISKIGAVRRLTSISLTDGTTQSRFMFWKMAVQGWQAKPILGWGWGQFEVISNKYYNPHLYSFEEWTDHAHNNLLDVLATTGSIGFVSYLAIFGTVFWYAYSDFRRQKIDHIGLASIIGFLTAYLIQNMFIFDMYASYVSLFIFFAFIQYWHTDQTDEIKNKITIEFVKGGRYAVVLIILLAVYGVNYINVIPMRSSYNATRALKYSALLSFNDTYMEFLTKALFYRNFGSQEIGFQLILEHVQFLFAKYKDAGISKQIDNLVSIGQNEFNASIKREPTVLRNYMGLAYLYLTEAKLNNADAKIWSEQALEIVTKGEYLSPNRQSLLFLKAEAYNGVNQLESALSILKKALELDKTNTDAYINYAKVAVYTSDKEKLSWLFDEAKKNNIQFDKEVLQNFLNIAVSKKDFSMIVYMYNRLVSLEPANPRYHSGLAAAYAGAGDRVNAIAEAKKAMELDPSFVVEGQAFINSLNKIKK